MRKIFFWTHLIGGTLAAVVILIMCVTGVLLTYERQMVGWADKSFQSTPTGSQMQPGALLRNIAEQTGSMPESLTLRKDASAPVEVAMGTRILYADAYSGKVLGQGSTGIRRFFRVVTDWHRWLAMEGPRRQFGRSVTGAANLIFLVLAMSGMYLWLPRKPSWSSLRAVLWFRRGLSGKARDFNWHNAIGIWCALPLIAVIVGALVISYPWATALVYRAAGNEPPKTAPAPARPGGGGGGVSARQPDFTGLDAAWQQATMLVPGWQTITVRPAAGNRISLAVAESLQRGRVDLRSTVVIHRTTGAVIDHEKFSGYEQGRQWRMWLRFIHTGEAFGIPGQTVAGVVSAGGAVLVWTGIALTWRRFRAWRDRRSARRSETPVTTRVLT